MLLHRVLRSFADMVHNGSKKYLKTNRFKGFRVWCAEVKMGRFCDTSNAFSIFLVASAGAQGGRKGDCKRHCFSKVLARVGVPLPAGSEFHWFYLARVL